ncbi:MAG: endonuclease III [Thaumarchaeota archaeon]|nr:endonuclease III [Candidatus Calditenuaceae archaeon]MDW8187603.1 endonuclease III [Nitrososphaerota archaeon]
MSEEAGSVFGLNVLEKLRSAYKLDYEEFVSKFVASVTGSPFKALVATVLSQNSTDKAAIKAYKSLDEEVGVDPFKISSVPLGRIKRCVRVAGLSDSKARAIKSLARYASSSGDPDLKSLMAKGPEAAREILTSVKGIGPKTADVVLVTFGVLETVPVDTHVKRVASRLGLVREGAGYEEVRKTLDALFPAPARHEAHLLLITHGRRVCRSRRPLCEICVLNDVCRFFAIHTSTATRNAVSRVRAKRVG